MNNGMKKMEPPDKRRKTNNINMTSFPENPEVWDDEEENDFTVDELENIDKIVSMSQMETSNATKVLGATPSCIATGRSVGRGTGRSNSMGDMCRPWSNNPLKQNQRQSSASHMYKPKILKQTKHVPTASETSNVHRSTANPLPRGPPYHSSLHPVIGVTGSGTSAALPSSHPNETTLLQKNFEKTRDEKDFYKKQVQQLKDAQICKDGQIQILKTSLREREAELTQQKQERMTLIGLHQQEKTEKESYLEKEIERLKTQLQFKDHEIVDLQQNCRKLDQRLKMGCMSIGDTQAQSPNRRQPPHSPKSPKITRKAPASPVTPSRLAFPTPQTFLAEERSPIRSRCSSAGSLGDKTVFPQTRKMIHQKPQRKMCLSLQNSKGLLTGCHLVSRLINTSVCMMQKSGVKTEEGVLGLLQIPADLRKPMPSRMMPYIVGDSSATLNKEHYNFAIDSLSQLLSDSSTNETTSSPPTMLQAYTQYSVCLLPIIEDCVSAYVDYLQSTGIAMTQSTQNTISTIHSIGMLRSRDSCITACFGRPNRHSTSQIENMEWKARTALCVLRELVTYCQYVRRAMLAEHHQMFTEDTAVDIQQPHVFPGPSSADEQQGSTVASTCDSALETLQDMTLSRIVRESQLLKMIVHLANAVPNKICPPSLSVVQLSLEILTSLTQSTPANTSQRLECLFTNNILRSCLSDELPVTSRSTLHMCMSALLQSLVQWPFALKHLCSKSEECLLLSIYNTCLVCNENCRRSPLTENIVSALSTLVSFHRHGTQLLLESDCNCSVELIKCVICLLYWELQHYRKLVRRSKSSSCKSGQSSLRLLREGATLLATFSTHDRLFTQHHSEVEQHCYVELVCGLDAIFRKHSTVQEHEMTVIQDLWDFDQEYTENTPQEGSRMDTS